MIRKMTVTMTMTMTMTMKVTMIMIMKTFRQVKGTVHIQRMLTNMKFDSAALVTSCKKMD